MKKEAFVYVGPNRPFGKPLRRNTILAAEPEKVFPDLKPFFEEHKQFRKLFVPVSDLAEVRKSMNEAGSALNIWSEQIRNASEQAAKEKSHV